MVVESPAQISSVCRDVAAHGGKPPQAYPAPDRLIAGAHWKGPSAARTAVTICRQYSWPQGSALWTLVVPGHVGARDRLLLRIGPALVVCDSGACSKLCRQRCAATSGNRGVANLPQSDDFGSPPPTQCQRLGFARKARSTSLRSLSSWSR